ncbi:unnamed protein product [Caenorhabditis bovis]|uniref:Peptidase metallopeptidase domain-containing protein n=1 Tax=Caenorhabditis bovis TaxID=2654633 RepID=A0A8S1EQ35_9PELO|nr:unnamed protein product [Caenorhabditis bovis]
MRRRILLLLIVVAAHQCFDADFVAPARREKRYVVRAKRWHKSRFTWKLLPDNLDDADIFIVRNTLHRAFNEWQTVSSAEFEETAGTPDITIAFRKGEHHDGYPFDGEDGVVAHAFYPRDGRLHFDADEKWSLNSDEGVNLFQTAVHEIGHLLGLEHSMDVRAAMYAAKRPYDPGFTLGDDDVRAIRALFPMMEEVATSTPSTTTISTTTIEFTDEEKDDPFESSSPKSRRTSVDSFFPFPLPSIEYFQKRPDWFVL